MYKKSEIEIEVLPANEGDCILITIEKEDIHILIDGGTAETYRNYLKTRLIQLKNEGKVIDLLIVTHIDNDHIGGIIELFKENGSDMDSKIIRIRNIWHNSYRHLQFEKNQKLGRSEKNIIESLKSLTKDIRTKENESRVIVNMEASIELEDDIYRSLGILQNSRIISAQEAMKHLSNIKLGIEMDYIKDINLEKVINLMKGMKPAMRLMSPITSDGDIKRADFLREEFTLANRNKK
mgnify:CR=1 FL=1